MKEQLLKTYRVNILLVFLTCGLALPWGTSSHRFKVDAKNLARQGWRVQSFSKIKNYGPIVVTYEREN